MVEWIGIRPEKRNKKWGQRALRISYEPVSDRPWSLPFGRTEYDQFCS